MKVTSRKPDSARKKEHQDVGSIQTIVGHELKMSFLMDGRAWEITFTRDEAQALFNSLTSFLCEVPKEKL